MGGCLRRPCYKEACGDGRAERRGRAAHYAWVANAQPRERCILAAVSVQWVEWDEVVQIQVRYTAESRVGQKRFTERDRR